MADNPFKLARTEHNQHGFQSVKTVAHVTGISKNMIDDLESEVGGKRGVSYIKVAELAKHYGVSSDYLLGLSKSPSTDPNIRAIKKYTGLQDGSIKMLHNISQSATGKNAIVKLVDNLLSDQYERGDKYLNAISESICLAAWAEANVVKQDITMEALLDLDEKELALTIGRLRDNAKTQDQITVQAIMNGESMVPIPANDVAILYSRRALNLMEQIIQDTIETMEKDFEKKLANSKSKK